MTDDFEGVQISVVGVGGGGSNCVSRMMSSGIKSARTVAINTDSRHLLITQAHKKVLIGKKITRGMGAGGDEKIGEKCAEMDAALIKEAIGNSNLVFVTAGMGGGTGSGAAPVVARIAKEMGAITIGVVTYPFALERTRLRKAEMAINRMVKECDTLVVIDNNRLLSYAPNLPLNQALEMVDSVTQRAVVGISDTIILPSLMNIDYADVKSVMANRGIAMISLGEGYGYTKIEDAAKSALEHPLLDTTYEGAKAALVHIEGNSSLTLGEAIKLGNMITDRFDPDANVKIGARILPDIEGVRVTTIVAGLSSPCFLNGKATSSSANSVVQNYSPETLYTL
ncbi:MAG: cell division protein FtsZ [Candidatus Anstonellales archaeon]